MSTGILFNVVWL